MMNVTPHCNPFFLYKLLVHFPIAAVMGHIQVVHIGALGLHKQMPRGNSCLPKNKMEKKGTGLYSRSQLQHSKIEVM